MKKWKVESWSVGTVSDDEFVEMFLQELTDEGWIIETVGVAPSGFGGSPRLVIVAYKETTDHNGKTYKVPPAYTREYT